MRNTKHTFWEEILLFGPLRYLIPCGLILLIVWLCVSIPKWSSSIKEEVAYDENLRNHSPVYADVVSIEPIEEDFSLSSETYNLFCKCELVNGDTIWMQFTKPQYIDDIDPNYENPNIAEICLYATPLRVHGTVDTLGRVINAFQGNNNFVLIVDSVEILHS